MNDNAMNYNDINDIGINDNDIYNDINDEVNTRQNAMTYLRT